jgi:hypothetical protein
MTQAGAYSYPAMSKNNGVLAASTPHPARDNTTYSGNRADGNSTIFYGDVYGGLQLPSMPAPQGHSITHTGHRADGDAIQINGDLHGNLHLPERPREAGEPSPHQCLRDVRVTDPREDRAAENDGHESVSRVSIFNDPKDSAVTFLHRTVRKFLEAGVSVGSEGQKDTGAKQQEESDTITASNEREHRRVFELTGAEPAHTLQEKPVGYYGVDHKSKPGLSLDATSGELWGLPNDGTGVDHSAGGAKPRRRGTQREHDPDKPSGWAPVVLEAEDSIPSLKEEFMQEHFEPERSDEHHPPSSASKISDPIAHERRHENPNSEVRSKPEEQANIATHLSTTDDLPENATPERSTKYGGHRDIKPENILRYKDDRDGILMIADLGLTKFDATRANRLANHLIPNDKPGASSHLVLGDSPSDGDDEGDGDGDLTVPDPSGVQYAGVKQASSIEHGMRALDTNTNMDFEQCNYNMFNDNNQEDFVDSLSVDEAPQDRADQAKGTDLHVVEELSDHAVAIDKETYRNPRVPWEPVPVSSTTPLIHNVAKKTFDIIRAVPQTAVSQPVSDVEQGDETTQEIASSKGKHTVGGLTFAKGKSVALSSTDVPKSKPEEIPVLRDSEWELYKDRITELYRDTTLKDVMIVLEAETGFKASYVSQVAVIIRVGYSYDRADYSLVFVSTNHA